MPVSAMLFYCKLTKALLSYFFELNPYDPYFSHIDPKVNDKFLQWIKDTFGQLREVKMTWGPLLGYLGMTLAFSVPGQVSINMSHYVKKMVKEFPQENLNRAPVALLWNENLF